MLEVQGNGWFDSFIINAAYKRLEEPTSYLGWISRKIILLVDDIFAVFSSTYQNKRTEFTNQIKLMKANPATPQFSKTSQKSKELAKAACITPESTVALETQKSVLYKAAHYPEPEIELEDEIEPEEQNDGIAQVEQDLPIDHSKEKIKQAEQPTVQPVQNLEANIKFVEARKAISEYIKLEFPEDAILSIVMEDFKDLTAEECLSILAEQKKAKLEGKLEPLTNPDIIPKEFFDLGALDKPLVAPSESDLILSALSGEKSSNISFSCSFIASQEDASSKMITDIICNKNFSNQLFNDDISACISQCELKMLPNNPWDFQKGGQTMCVSCDRKERNGIHMAVKTLVENGDIKGAIISWNKITTAIRKKGTNIEFFDPSGELKISGSGNPAYVKVFSKEQQEELIKLILIKYSSTDKDQLLEIFPIG